MLRRDERHESVLAPWLPGLALGWLVACSTPASRGTPGDAIAADDALSSDGAAPEGDAALDDKGQADHGSQAEQNVNDVFHVVVL